MANHDTGNPGQHLVTRLDHKHHRTLVLRKGQNSLEHISSVIIHNKHVILGTKFIIQQFYCLTQSTLSASPLHLLGPRLKETSAHELLP